MTIQRMEHVGIGVDDLEAATAFLVELGLKLHGEGQVEGGWVDRVVGPDASGRVPDAVERGDLALGTPQAMVLVRRMEGAAAAATR